MTPWLNRLWRTVRWPGASGHHTPRPTSLEPARQALLQVIEDCEGLPARRLKLQIETARDRRDLWQLRSEAFHLIALLHCQRVADERIAGILHHFGADMGAGRPGRPA